MLILFVIIKAQKLKGEYEMKKLFSNVLLTLLVIYWVIPFDFMPGTIIDDLIATAIFVWTKTKLLKKQID